MLVIFIAIDPVELQPLHDFESNQKHVLSCTKLGNYLMKDRVFCEYTIPFLSILCQLATTRVWHSTEKKSRPGEWHRQIRLVVTRRDQLALRALHGEAKYFCVETAEQVYCIGRPKA